MKKVMVRAWEIAKEAVAKFGGKVKEFFQQALIMAWSEFKKGADIMNETLVKVLEAIEKHDIANGNSIWLRESKEEAIKMFNAGFESLEDGQIVSAKGRNLVAVKEGNTVVVKRAKDGMTLRSGKVIAGDFEVAKVVEVTADKKEDFLAQAIVSRFYTI